MPVPTNKLLEKVLDYSFVKQNVISENITNVATKNYKRKDVKFDDVLSDEIGSQLKISNAKHMNTSSIGSEKGFKIVEDTDHINKSGTNSIDINQEMADMAQNALLFRMASRKLKGYYSTLQKVIKGGR
jgi:flagellar basal-body rod protein FlgB